MSLHVIVGFTGSENTADPEVVYAGRSRTDAQTAMDASLCDSFLVLQNPLGYRKNNARAVENRAAQDPEAVKAAAFKREKKRLEDENMADEIRRQAQAEAKAAVKSGEVARVASEVVKRALADVIAEAGQPLPEETEKKPTGKKSAKKEQASADSGGAGGHFSGKTAGP